MAYYVCGIGFVTPESYGCGKDFHAFDPKPGGKLKPVARKDVLDQPYKPYGRMDFFSKTGFSGIYFAGKDAEFHEKSLVDADKILQKEKNCNSYDNGKVSNTSIIASSVYGCIDTDKNFFNTFRSENGKNASPALFAYTLPNTFLGEASIYFGFTGQNFIINEKTSNGMTSLKMGIDILHSGESDSVICGICDTAFSEKYDYFTGSLFFLISRISRQFFYGKIDINNNKIIDFNGKPVNDLKTLAQLCLKAHSDPGIN